VLLRPFGGDVRVVDPVEDVTGVVPVLTATDLSWTTPAGPHTVPIQP
jgi:hypothetical protein